MRFGGLGLRRLLHGRRAWRNWLALCRLFLCPRLSQKTVASSFIAGVGVGFVVRRPSSFLGACVAVPVLPPAATPAPPPAPVPTPPSPSPPPSPPLLLLLPLGGGYRLAAGVGRGHSRGLLRNGRGLCREFGVLARRRWLLLARRLLSLHGGAEGHLLHCCIHGCPLSPHLLSPHRPGLEKLMRPAECHCPELLHLLQLLRGWLE